MAALGWLVSLAGRAAEPARDDVVAGFRAAAEKPADAHAIWNWFYLCAMRMTMPVLSRPAGS